jgi:tetratricopeptide (TPR) repeat protein
MKIKRLITLMLLFSLSLYVATWTIAEQSGEKGTGKGAAAAQGSEQKMDEVSFIGNFAEAYKANDQAKMGELVRQAEPIVFNVVELLATMGIESRAKGEDNAAGYFKVAEAIAAVYAREFSREGLLDLVRKYISYSQEMCKERFKGDELIHEGTLLYEKSQWKDAANKWTEALKIFRKIGDVAGGARALGNIGVVYDSLGQYTEALGYYQQALEIARKIGDVAGEANDLGNIGIVYDRLGQYTEALGYYQQALEIARKIGDVAGEANDLGNIGVVYKNLGQYTEALSYHQQALAIARKIGDVAGEANDLGNIGNVYDCLGQYTEALSYYQEALEIKRKIGDVTGEAAALSNIGNVYDRLGQYTEALSYSQQALEIARKIGDVAGEATTLSNIGNVYDRLGQYTEALSYYQEALEIARKIGDVAEEARALGNIGVVYDHLGQYAEALSHYQQALEIKRKIGDVAGEANSLTNIGLLHGSLGQYTEALSYHQQALAIARKIGDVAEEATILLSIGLVYDSLGQYTEAIRPFQESIKISEKIGELETVWMTNTGLGASLWKSGNPEEAVAHFKKAVDTIEVLYQHTTGLKAEERSSMIGGKSFVYQAFIELLLELHRKHPAKGYDKQTFIIAEKAKSRTFQELMAKAGAKIAFAEEAKDETFKKMIEKEQQLIMEITNLRTLLTKELSKPEKAQNQGVIASLKEQLSKTEKTLEEHEKEIDTKYPRYADLKRPKSLTVEELQEVLKPGETIVAYAVGRDKTVAFVIAKGRFKMVELPISPGELAQLVKQFRKGLEDIYELKDLEKFDPEIAYTLYQRLIAPLSSDLKGVTKLYISADNILYTLPFEALVDQEVNKEAFRAARSQWRQGQGAYLGAYATLHYLVDTYTITYLPSASVLRSLRKYEKPGYGKWTKPLIAFADPIFSLEEGKEGKHKGITGKGISKETALTAQILTRSTGAGELERLKESAEEAMAIGKEVKGKEEDIYLREKASEANVYKAKLKDFRYILFSTHGLLGGDFTGVAEPALVLTLINNPPGRDGFLTMSKVLGLDLNAELVILSACNTSGRGEKTGAGEGFVGLTRSFMYAGTRSILVTHWSVESQAARDLMVWTIKNMGKEGGPEALREAKLRMKGSVRDDKEVPGGKFSLSHPFFWAPFVLVGEGK